MALKTLRDHPLLCRLVWHRDDGTESGYGVCGRCGLHDYHDHEEKYGPGKAVISVAIDRLLSPFRRLAKAYGDWRCEIVLRRGSEDGIPF